MEALIIKLILGSYIYTTLAVGALWKFITGNHLKALAKRVKALEDKQ